MEIGMAAKEDGENASQEGDRRIIVLALQAVYKGTGKGKVLLWQGSEAGMRRVAKAARMEEKNSWQKGSGKTGRQRARERRQGRNQNVLDVRQDRTHCSLVQERRKQEPVRHGRR